MSQQNHGAGNDAAHPVSTMRRKDPPHIHANDHELDDARHNPGSAVWERIHSCIECQKRYHGLCQE